jgi:hypothetical protein
MRMVLMHVRTSSSPSLIQSSARKQLANNKDVVARAARLVKPGGWLLIEETEPGSMVDTGGPAAARFISLWMELLRGYDATPEIAKDLKQILDSLGLFSQVIVDTLAIPMSGISDGA